MMNRKTSYLTLALLLAVCPVQANTMQLLSIVEKYRASLPKLEAKDDSANGLAAAVVDFLGRFRTMPAPRVEGRDELIKQIEGDIAAKRQIRFLLPAFPGKSQNTVKKVLGSNPDLGDLLGLHTLDHICKEIAHLYRPGASVTLVSDGVFVAEALHISEASVAEYVEKIRALIRLFKMPIEILTLGDFKETPTYQKSFSEIQAVLNEDNQVVYDQATYLPFARRELDCPHYASIAKKVALQATKLQKKFKELPGEDRKFIEDMDLDFDATKSFLESLGQNSIANNLASQYLTALKRKPSQVATALARGGIQFSHYLSSITADQHFVRLSVNLHHTDISKKLPITLIYGSDGTPWHHVPVVDEMGSVGIRVRLTDRDGLVRRTFKEAYLPELDSFKIAWME